MMFFNRNKLKFRSESIEDQFKYYVDYSRLNNPDNFKKELFKNFIGEKNYLMVINTKMIYKKYHDDFRRELDGLIELLDEMGITYKKIFFKKCEDAAIFGVKINLNNKPKYKDFIVGLAVNFEELESVKKIIGSYNISYYVHKDVVSKEALMERFSLNYDDEDELREGFQYFIFDNPLINQVAITVHKENEKEIKEIVSSIKI